MGSDRHILPRAAARKRLTMADVINLRLARKARARTGKQAQAAANRALFGETREVRQMRDAEASRTTRTLDGVKREQD